jgi:hypothetical protein
MVTAATAWVQWSLPGYGGLRLANPSQPGNSSRSLVKLAQPDYNKRGVVNSATAAWLPRVCNGEGQHNVMINRPEEKPLVTARLDHGAGSG